VDLHINRCYRSFFVSIITDSVVKRRDWLEFESSERRSGWGLVSMPVTTGEPFDEASASLGVGEVRPDVDGAPGLAVVASASSFRNASSSLSNLECSYQKVCIIEGKGALSTKDLDVESPAVPHAHSEDAEQIYSAPQWAVIKHKHSRELRNQRIHYKKVVVKYLA
jgi:hypothetical protein